MVILTDPETLARLRAAREKTRELRRALRPSAPNYRQVSAELRTVAAQLHNASPHVLGELMATETALGFAENHEFDNPAGAERLRRWAFTETRP